MLTIVLCSYDYGHGLVTLIGVLLFDAGCNDDFSGVKCSGVEDVLDAGEALDCGGSWWWTCGEVVKLSGPNGDPFDSTELSGGIPLWPNVAPNVLW